MTRQPSLRSAQWLLAAGLLAGMAAAHAATGFDVGLGQEALVHPGMTMAQVQTELGTPDQKIQYPTEMGPTWIYRVGGSSTEGAAYNVDFGSNGKVASASQDIPPQLY